MDRNQRNYTIVLTITLVTEIENRIIKTVQVVFKAQRWNSICAILKIR